MSQNARSAPAAAIFITARHFYSFVLPGEGKRGKVSADQNSAIKERKSRRRRRFSKYGIKPWCTAGGFLFFMWPTGCTFYGAPHAIYEASAGENTNYRHTASL